MDLRLDHLLRQLRDNTAAILEAIDQDPLLLKRSSGELVLANPSRALYTPQTTHQLYAKGIVYQRHPYRLVSLPLVKIYNLGERDITLTELAGLCAEPNVGLRFLRKIDGSLIQVFRHAGHVVFTTRGMLEGSTLGPGPESGEDRSDFDFVAAARRLAAQRYPRLLEDADLLDGRTLLFELIHPDVPKVTRYGPQADLVLLACFEQRRFSYLTYPLLMALAPEHGLSLVDAFAPVGATLAEQIDGLLASLAGTDQEGTVLCFERGEEVIYRVKVKSPDYLQLMRQMSECTYERTVAILDVHPQLVRWEDLRAHLQAEGTEQVPEEVLVFYRQHQERFQAYLAGCEQLLQWAQKTCRRLEEQLAGTAERGSPAFRKAFAALATRQPHAGLLFAALDGRLDLARVRRYVPSAAEVRSVLADLAGRE
jgi:hypothetical protein